MPANSSFTPRQERLLARLIEAASQVPEGENDEFTWWFTSSSDGDDSTIHHPNLEGGYIEARVGDIRALERGDLIDTWKDKPTHDASHLVLTQSGFMYAQNPSLPLNAEKRESVIQYIIHNHGGTAAMFDQKGQQIYGNQYNAAGDINISSVQNAVELVPLLEHFKVELRQAGTDKVIEGDVVDDAEYQVQKAITEAGKDNPDGGKILGYIKQAKEYITTTNAAVIAGTTLMNNIDKIQDIALKLFS